MGIELFDDIEIMQMKENKSRLRVPEGIDTLTAQEYQDLVNNNHIPKRKSKYNSQVTEIGGLKFDSKKEAKRYRDLCLLKKEGHIKDFQRQVKFVLLPKIRGVFREKYYKADFVIEYHDGSKVVEDVKSPATKKKTGYQFKKHFMYEKYGILIRET